MKIYYSVFALFLSLTLFSQTEKTITLNCELAKVQSEFENNNGIVLEHRQTRFYYEPRPGAGNCELLFEAITQVNNLKSVNISWERCGSIIQISGNTSNKYNFSEIKTEEDGDIYSATNGNLKVFFYKFDSRFYVPLRIIETISDSSVSWVFTFQKIDNSLSNKLNESLIESYEFRIRKLMLEKINYSPVSSEPVKSGTPVISEPVPVTQFVYKYDKPVANYTVQKGDVLSKIAEKHNCYMSELISWNDLKSNVVNPGTELVIYKSKKQQFEENIINNGGVIHNVRKGDYLGKLAIHYGCKIEDIKKWNNLKSNTILIGQKLVMYINEPVLAGTSPVQKQPDKITEPVKEIIKENKEIITKETANYSEEAIEASEAEINKLTKQAAATIDSLTSKVKELESKLNEIQQFLESLKSGKQNLSNEYDYTELDTGITLIDSLTFKQICDSKTEAIFSDSSDNKKINMKEYFYFAINEKGLVDEVFDERTQTNKNTRLFTEEEINQFKKLKFSIPQKDNKAVLTNLPLGITVKAEKSNIVIKKKGEKIRIYKRPFYVEYIDSESILYNAIMQKFSELEKKRGKFTALIVEKNYEAYDMKNMEYNPFAEKKSDLYRYNDFSVEKLGKKTLSPVQDY